MEKINPNQIMSGTFGKLWVNNDLMTNAVSFKATMKPKYEDVELNGELGVGRKFMGYEIEGSMKMHKVDNKLAKTIANGFMTGIMPEIKLNSEIDDPASLEPVRVLLTGITFDDVDLINFENKAKAEEEFSFKAFKAQYL